MYANEKMVLQLISLLKQFGVRKIVVSPGSRHNKIVRSLEQDNFFQLYIVVDERSAAFFALGLIQSSGETVAVTCSSGTACMNYGSAIVEAYYQKLPLLVLSSDRTLELLNQNEDQMYDQLSTFVKCTKYHCQLPIINNAADEWYCNRIINEALIALTHRGRGPVHINIPFATHHGVDFSVENLPVVRKITLNQLPLPMEFWKEKAQELSGKKIMIIWGQSVYPLVDVEKGADEFIRKSDAIVLTDNISNCHCCNSIFNTTTVLAIMKPTEMESLKPDYIITVGGNYIFNNEIKRWLKGMQCKHWHVGREGEVCDPFRCLSEIYEMPENHFFEQLAKIMETSSNINYSKQWKVISESPGIPEMGYCELFAITTLLKQLPINSDLQLANSQTIRMSQFVPINRNIRVNCNRGVNGIDGSMSTAVGFAADNNRLLFYVTGELSFFYDMNSLSIKHLSKQMRILLVNNAGGAVMYDQPRNTPVEKLPIYLAAGRQLTAKGWAESLGIKYLSANSKESVEEGVQELLNEDIQKPILLEVFSNLSDDRFCIGDYTHSLDRRTLSEKVSGKLKSFILKH